MATYSIAPVVTQQRLAELLHGNGRGVAGVRLANLIGHVEEVGSVLLDGLTAARRIDKIFFYLGSLRQQRLLLNQKGGGGHVDQGALLPVGCRNGKNWYLAICDTSPERVVMMLPSARRIVLLAVSSRR